METSYIILLVLAITSIAAYFLTGSVMAVGVVLTLGAIAFYIYEVYQSKTLNVQDLSFFPSGSEDIFKKLQLPKDPGGLKEVFFISGDQYSYEEAPAVCAVYDSELATYEQVVEALGKGAEWCGYGWTQGGMALFPTQEASWRKYQNEVDQKKRTRCGRPGINGGYFDAKTKFGVNCFGTKPGCNNKKYPVPFDTNIDKDLLKSLKENSGAIKVDPFNRNGWSMWGMLA